MMRIKNNLKIKRSLWFAVLLFAVNALFSTPSSGVVNIPVVLSNGIISVEVNESHDSPPADGKMEFGHRRLNAGDKAYMAADKSISKDPTKGDYIGIIFYILKPSDKDIIYLNNNVFPKDNGKPGFTWDPLLQHGLIMADQDLPIQYQFSSKMAQIYPDEYSKDDPRKCALGTGWQNTLNVIAQNVTDPIELESTAAYHCTQYAVGGTYDWYQPSIGELQEIYKKLSILEPSGSSFSPVEHIASSEVGYKFVWSVDFMTGQTSNQFLKVGRMTPIRPVRAF